VALCARHAAVRTAVVAEGGGAVHRSVTSDALSSISSGSRTSPLVSSSSSSGAPVDVTTAARSDAPLEPYGGGAGLPAIASSSDRSGAFGISYRGALEEDAAGGARHSTMVSKMWSNIPAHVRASFQAPKTLDEAPKGSVPQVFDSAVAQAKALVASTGLAPASWSPGATAVYYDGRYPLAPYKKGQTAAYNYPSVLVPREFSHRVPMDMYIDPVFQTSDPEQKARARARTLFPCVQGKTTLLMVFSAQPMSGLFTGLKRWLDLVGEDFLERKNTQVLKLHCEEGWLNRRTHALTKFHLRRQVSEDELFTTFVYRGKWKWEYVRALHLYDKELPVVLLVDALGYVRWHAVGLPTDEATALFRTLSSRLATERRNFL